MIEKINKSGRLTPPKFMWTYFACIGRSMWGKQLTELDFDYDVWQEMTERMAKGGLNVLVIDVAESLVYPSHPELRVKGSWEPERMRAEVDRLAKMGIMAVPKLNFSACHDDWLGEYSRMLSTPEYYKVCADVIADIAKVFDKAPFLHLGHDEEEYLDQEPYDHVAIRQGELWWHDVLFTIDEARKGGFRPWVWADPVWFKKEEYLRRMPKDVLQSNWYYFTEFGGKPGDMMNAQRPQQAPYYKVLSDAGFEQVPCSSNYRIDENCALTALHCRRVIKPELLKGFMHTTWGATAKRQREKIMKGVAQLVAVKRALG